MVSSQSDPTLEELEAVSFCTSQSEEGNQSRRVSPETDCYRKLQLENSQVKTVTEREGPPASQTLP